MKTIDGRGHELGQNGHMRGEVVIEDGKYTEDEKLAMPSRAVTSQFITSLAPKNGALAPKSAPVISKKVRPLSERESGSIARLQAEFLHVSLPLFFADQYPVRSIGVTSAIAGEGKTLSALLVSHALATSSRRPVLLVECDWERPTLARDLHLPASPGLSEWLRGTTDRLDVRHQFMPNLTVVPAGLGGPDAMTALAELRRPELRERLADPDELMILDLPSVLGSYYGLLAARLAETLFLVVRAGSTPVSFITRATDELKELRVEGIILNQVRTRVPRWLQSLL
jgi:Mrp family chromosome partitioning ATPase